MLIYAMASVHRIRYSLSVHANSNIRMNAGLLQANYEPGPDLTLRAQLTETNRIVFSGMTCHSFRNAMVGSPLPAILPKFPHCIVHELRIHHLRQVHFFLHVTIGYIPVLVRRDAGHT